MSCGGVPLEDLQLSHTVEAVPLVVKREEHGVQSRLLGAGAIAPTAQAGGDMEYRVNCHPAISVISSNLNRSADLAVFLQCHFLK